VTSNRFNMGDGDIFWRRWDGVQLPVADIQVRIQGVGFIRNIVGCEMRLVQYRMDVICNKLVAVGNQPPRTRIRRLRIGSGPMEGTYFVEGRFGSACDDEVIVPVSSADEVPNKGHVEHHAGQDHPSTRVTATETPGFLPDGARLYSGQHKHQVTEKKQFHRRIFGGQLRGQSPISEK
jgi:hypothetical protein